MNTRHSRQPATPTFLCGLLAASCVGLTACTVDPGTLADVTAAAQSSNGFPTASFSQEEVLGDYPAGHALLPVSSGRNGPGQETVVQVLQKEAIRTLFSVVRGAVTIAVSEATGSQAPEPFVGGIYGSSLD